MLISIAIFSFLGLCFFSLGFFLQKMLDRLSKLVGQLKHFSLAPTEWSSQIAQPVQIHFCFTEEQHSSWGSTEKEPPNLENRQKLILLKREAETPITHCFQVKNVRKTYYFWHCQRKICSLKHIWQWQRSMKVPRFWSHPNSPSSVCNGCLRGIPVKRLHLKSGLDCTALQGGHGWILSKKHIPGLLFQQQCYKKIVEKIILELSGE